MGVFLTLPFSQFMVLIDYYFEGQQSIIGSSK